MEKRLQRKISALPERIIYLTTETVEMFYKMLFEIKPVDMLQQSIKAP